MKYVQMDLIPDNPLDLLHYKELNHIRNILLNRNHSNLIIYGPSKCGKTLIISELFKYLYGDLSVIEDNKKITVYGNISYYYIYSDMIYDKIYFKEYIKELINTYDYYTDKIKYIIIDNFENINISIQRFLKVILEKSYRTTKFIIITNILNNIDVSIKSRCSLIRIPLPTYINKKIYLMNLFNKHDISFNEFLLEKDCKKYNLENIIYKYQSNCNYEDIYQTYKDRFLDMVIMKDFNLLNIKSLSSNIKEINLDLEEFFKLLLDNLMEICNNDIISLLIKEIAKYNHIIKQSYRDIIYIELILISIFRIINKC